MPLRTRTIFAEDVGRTAAVLGSLSASAVLLVPVLRPGYALFLDHVTVPDPVAPQWSHLTTSAGLRAWPLDGAVWLWSQVLPTWALQQAILVIAVAGAGLGSGLLLRRWGAVAAFAASVLTIANPYVIERLLLGQAALLLAYASIPWIVIASRQSSRARRVILTTLVSLPAAITPWGGLVAGSVAISSALVRRRHPREALLQALASAALCLVWLVPAMLGSPGGADPEGARAFALTDETGLGLFGSALLGAGVWSSAAQATEGNALFVGAAGLLVGLCVLGARVMARRNVAKAGVLVGVMLGVPAVAALLSGPALSGWAWSQTLPGVAMFRDLHRILAPSVLALVVLSAIGLSGLVATLTAGRALLATALALVLSFSLVAMLVPAGPGRVHDAYRTVWFPTEWDAALSVLDGPGRVLSLPWQPLRQTAWAPNVFLDPSAKALGPRLVGDTTLTVARSGAAVRVSETGPPEGVVGATGSDLDTLRQTLTEAGVDALPSQLLASSGVTHLIVWKASPGYLPRVPPDWRRTFSGEHFEVWSDPGVTTR